MSAGAGARAGRRVEPIRGPAEEKLRSAASGRPRIGLLAPAFFLSGAAALVYELLWFRLLGHVFGSTATATTTLLAAYLFGLGLGAWVFGRLSDRIANHARVYAMTELGIGLFGIASRFLLMASAPLFMAVQDAAGGSGALLLAGRFGVSFVLIGLPTFLMGGTFPLMVHLLGARERGDPAGGRRGAAGRRGGAAGVPERPEGELGGPAAEPGRPGGGLGGPVGMPERAGAAGRGTGAAAGRAYAVNTAGAALGVLALPFWLLPALGVTGSLVAAALGNCLAAGFAIAARGSAERDAEAPSAARAPGLGAPEGQGGAAGSRRGGAEASSSRAVLLGALFLSSFAAIALENLWTRHLGIIFGAQIYLFAFVLFAYLTGLFLGGALCARAARAGRSPAGLFRAGLLLSGGAVALQVPFLDRAMFPQADLMLGLGVSHATFLLTSALETLALIGPAAAGFGIVFPAAIHLLALQGARRGAAVGAAYAVNTMGTTLGAALSGFVLVPALGSQRSFEASILMIAGAYALLLLVPDPAGEAAAPGRRGGRWRWALAACAPAVLFLPPWDWRYAHAGYAKAPLIFLENYQAGSLDAEIATYGLIYMKEGAEATVSVNQLANAGRSLYVDGKPDASDSPGDMVTQRLIAIVPMLFRPGARSAFVVGLGSGTTAGTLAMFPLASIDVAEISPEVVEAARRFYANANGGVLDDPRVKLHRDDARNVLRAAPPAAYDLIVSEPSNPWMAGVSGLFTEDFFREARVRLKRGGVFCQWFHLYSMSLEDVRLLLRTFVAVFPECAIFAPHGEGPTGDLVLIGSNERLRMTRLPGDPAIPPKAREALEQIGNGTVQQLLEALVATPASAGRIVGSGPLNTDDRPILELAAPAGRFVFESVRNLNSLLTASPSLYLPAGPPASSEPASGWLASLGFALPRGVPAGEETRRGAIVLTRVGRSRSGNEQDVIVRWVVMGLEFAEGSRVTGLYRLGRTEANPRKILDVASMLGARTKGSATGELAAGGERGVWVATDRMDGRGADATNGAAVGAERIVAIGRQCGEKGPSLFAIRREPLSGAPTAEAIVSDLTARFQCANAP